MAECYRESKIPAHSYPVADKVIIVEMVELVRYIRTRFLKGYHKDVGDSVFFHKSDLPVCNQRSASRRIYILSF